VYCKFTYEDDEAGWHTEILYKAKLRSGTCDDIIYFDAPFEYVFSNSTRNIETVIDTHENWDINDKHPAFYSGTDPSDKEVFLIDELMLILGKNGIHERSFDYIKETAISLSNKEYNTRLFQLSTSAYRYEFI